ncbi:MAG: hypothetical protein H7837_09870 [Magnetococcus sp. MYC-9]
MNKAARLVALMAAAGFMVSTAAYAADPAKVDCKGDKKCEEQQKAATKK